MVRNIDSGIQRDPQGSIFSVSFSISDFTEPMIHKGQKVFHSYICDTAVGSCIQM